VEFFTDSSTAFRIRDSRYWRGVVFSAEEIRSFTATTISALEPGGRRDALHGTNVAKKPSANNGGAKTIDEILRVTNGARMNRDHDRGGMPRLDLVANLPEEPRAQQLTWRIDVVSGCLLVSAPVRRIHQINYGAKARAPAAAVNFDEWRTRCFSCSGRVFLRPGVRASCRLPTRSTVAKNRCLSGVSQVQLEE